MSRGFVDTKTNSLVAAFRYPGTIGFVGRMDLATGKLTKLAGDQGHDALQGDQRRLRSGRPQSLLHRGQLRLPRPHRGRRRYRQEADAAARRAHRRHGRQPGATSRSGASATRTALRPSSAFPPPYAGFNQIHTFEYGQIPFDLDISPDGSHGLGSASARSTARSRCASGSSTSCRRTASRSEVARLDLPPSTPEGFIFTPDGKALYGTSYYTGVSNVFRFDIATQKYEVVSNASTGFFRPMPQPDGSLIAYEYSRRGPDSPSRIMPQGRRGPRHGRIPRHARSSTTHPELKTWGVGSPAKVALDALITARGKYNATERMKLAGHAIRSSKAIRARSRPAITSTSKTRCSSTSSTRASASRRSTSCATKERLHATLEYKTLNWKLAIPAQWRRLLRPVRAGRAQPQGRRLHRRLQQDDDLRPAAPARPVRHRRGLFRARAAAVRAEHRQPEEHRLGRGGREIHQHPQGAGRRRP